MRHNQLNEYLGVLDMEKESIDRAQILAWVLFPTWIVMSIIQSVCFILINGKFHPLAAILKANYDAIHGRLYRWTENSFPIFLYLKPVEISKKCFNIT